MTIDSYLSTKGSVFLVNPARGHSMASFLALAADRDFESEHVTFEDAKYQMQCKSAQTEPGFDEDKHCLFFIKLCRK